jgi:hypothetical protein
MPREEDGLGVGSAEQLLLLLEDEARSGRLERALATTAGTLGLSRLCIADVAVRHPTKLVNEAVSLHQQLSRSAEQQAELEQKHAALSLRKLEEKAQRTQWLRHTGPQQLPPALPRLLCQLAEEARSVSLEARALDTARSRRTSFDTESPPSPPAQLSSPGTRPSLDSMCPEAARLHAWQAAAPGLEHDAAQAREMKAQRADVKLKLRCEGGRVRLLRELQLNSRWPVLAPRAMTCEVDVAWNMCVDNLDLERPAAEQPRPKAPLSAMRQSVEATRNNPAVQAAQAAMGGVVAQAQGQGKGQGQGQGALGHRSPSGRRSALNGADGGTMAIQSRQILEEMSKHAWWGAGQVCYFCMGQRLAKRGPEKPRAASAASNGSGDGGPTEKVSRAGSPTAEHDELTPLSHMHHRYVDCPKRRAAGEKEHTVESIALALAAIGAERAELHAQLAVFAPLAELAAAAKLDLARCEGQIALLGQLTSGYDEPEGVDDIPPPPADKYLFYGPLYYKAYHAAFRKNHAYIGKAIAQAATLYTRGMCIA